MATDALVLDIELESKQQKRRHNVLKIFLIILIVVACIVTVTFITIKNTTSNTDDSAENVPSSASSQPLTVSVSSSSSNGLTSPPELEWSNPSGTVHEATMYYDLATHTIPGIGSFVSRVHNGAFPSPTIRMKPGHKYVLTFINNLEAEDPANANAQLNTYKDPNTTNLHTHGVHISGQAPGDDVFTVVHPGESHVYEWYIPCDHHGGVNWYHPHHHGSTTFQALSGAAGAVIIDENELYEGADHGFPAWYTELEADQLVLFILHVQLNKLTQLSSSMPADHVDPFPVGSPQSNDFYVINGQYLPTIEMQAGVWRKLRFLHVDAYTDQEFAIRFHVNYVHSHGLRLDDCTVYLLARDGILVHGADNTVPRLLSTNKIFLDVAGRADVAVSCEQPGSYELKAGNTKIADISVSGSQRVEAETLTTFQPKRPDYLASLMDYDGPFQQYPGNGGRTADEWSLNLGARTINGNQFESKTTYLQTIQAGTVNHWSVSGARLHPFHLHVNHFQVISGGDDATDPNMHVEGDWLDTLSANGDIRFRADRFGGKSILHCHYLEHEDQGAMGLIWIEGGCDYDGVSDVDENGISCASITDSNSIC